MIAMSSEDLSKQLNHQRVRQILSDHIPDDEAKLLSNGRLTCMICQHRPIFDCVKTLSQHRTGKKHLAELGKYLKCKLDHEYQNLKKKQNDLRLKGIVKSDKSKPKYMKRKLALFLPTSVNCKPDFSEREKLDFVQPSAATQVRSYLKSLSRKNGFEKSLEQAKESYGVNKSSQSSREIIKDKHSTLQNDHSSDQKCYDKCKAKLELSLRMSGWIRDSNGKWVKDPDAEFDSDEDEPPLLNQ